jgi:hypothetical protein
MFSTVGILFSPEGADTGLHASVSKTEVYDALR